MTTFVFFRVAITMLIPALLMVSCGGNQKIEPAAETADRFVIRELPQIPKVKELEYPDLVAGVVVERLDGDGQPDLIRFFWVKSRKIVSPELAKGSIIEVTKWETPEKVKGLRKVATKDAEHDEFISSEPKYASSFKIISTNGSGSSDARPEQKKPRFERKNRYPFETISSDLSEKYDFQWEQAESMRTFFTGQLQENPKGIGKRGNLIFDPTYFDIRWPEKEPWINNSISCLVAFRDFLREKDIELVVVPFPKREDVTGELFGVEVPESGPNPYRDKVIETLRLNEVDVLDLRELLLKKVEAGEQIFYSCRDEHPNRDGVVAGGKAVATHLQRYYEEQVSSSPAIATSVEETSFEIDEKFLYQGHTSGAIYPARTIRSDVEGIISDKESSILIVGDSYVNVPNGYGAFQANIPWQIAHELGKSVNTFNRGGGAPLMFKTLATEYDWDCSKPKVCVFYFRGYTMFYPLEKLKKSGRFWAIPN